MTFTTKQEPNHKTVHITYSTTMAAAENKLDFELM